MRTVILLNQGGGSAGEDSRDRVEAALRRAGIEGAVDLVPGPDLAARASRAVKEGAELVIAAGGDGSVGAVAGALVAGGAVLGVLPLGTLNHFARDLGIPFDLDEAAAVIAAGSPRTIDVARLNDHIFINNSALGLYPLMVSDRQVQQQRLGRSKRLATLVAGMRAMVRLHHHRLTLSIDQSRERPVETPLLFVGNNNYRLDAGGAGRRPSIEDGHLCVVALRKMGRAGLFAALVRALAGRVRDKDMIRLDGVARLRVDSRRSRLRVSLDGEIHHLPPPLDYAILPAALRVMAPR